MMMMMMDRKEKDRLSELPDSLIIHILGFMPITDVVRTTILSKRWKNLWTTIPCLDFVEYASEDEFRNFVVGALNSWKGVKIVRLSVELYFFQMSSDIDSWVHFAVEKKVEELKLCLPFRCKTYSVPQCVYSCSSLKKLELSYCDLQINDGINVQWDRLESLSISGELITANAMNKVLLGSPKLENLKLYFYGSIKENLNIRSSSLEYLYFNVGQFLPLFPFPWMYKGVRISTPNLKTFYIAGDPYMKFSLMNITSLTEAGLLINANPRPSRNDFVVKVLTQILPTIKHVERLALSDSCIEALGAVKEKHMLSPFPIANILKLKVGSRDHEQIARAIEMFPELRRLYLEINYEIPKCYESSFFEFDMSDYFKEKKKFDRNHPSCFLLQLTRVDVTWTRGDDDGVFELIYFFLEYALNLEKMVLKGEGIEPPTRAESLFMASLRLLRREKSSPTPEFIIC